MSMKKTDLEKLKGKKLAGGGPTPDRFGHGSAKHSRRGTTKKASVPLAVKMLKLPKD